jgi:hypothetical protein
MEAARGKTCHEVRAHLVTQVKETGHRSSDLPRCCWMFQVCTSSGTERCCHTCIRAGGGGASTALGERDRFAALDGGEPQRKPRRLAAVATR